MKKYNFLLEILIGVCLLLFINWIWVGENLGFAGVSPNPYWIVVIFIAARYGSLQGFSAGVICSLALLGSVSYGMFAGGEVDLGLLPYKVIQLCALFVLVGFLSFLVIYMFQVKNRWQKSNIYNEYEKYIFYDFEPEKKFLDPDNLAAATEAELEISPLVDVMGEEDAELRRGAVNIMEKLPKKDAVRLLQLSLQDSDVEIRFYAASELSKIETELNDNIITAKEEVERSPDSADAHLSLANSYSEYYESGILDEVTANYYRGLALGEYYTVLELGGENVKVMNYLANLEALNKEYDKALARFKRVCEIAPNDVYANVGIIHVYFETGKIAEAIKHARGIIKKMPVTKGPMRGIIQYWAA